VRHLIHAELRRALAGRMVLGLGVVSALFDMLSILGNGTKEQHALTAGSATVGGAEQALVSLGFGSLLFAAIAGAVTATSEYRHRSIARSLLLARGQRRLTVAKLVGALGPGGALGLVGAGTGLAGTAIWAAVHHHPFRWTGWLILTAVGVALVSLLAGPWGVAIGLAVRRQLPCVVGLIAWTVVADPAIGTWLPPVGRWLPGGAQEALYRDPQSQHVAMAAGGALFLAWIAAAAGTALWLGRRRGFA
jgi:ABC-2 type transport system permease protein